MLRVGLTGELGSGKSTVARMLAQRGAIVLSSDEMAREMMQPGHAAYDKIVERFGRSVVGPDGALDRRALTAAAFDANNPRVDELNAIIHPAVIAEQAKVVAEIAKTQPRAIVVVESALIFSTKYGSGWRERFDCVVVVTAPEEIQVERFLARVAKERRLSVVEADAIRADARQRLAAQRVDAPSAMTVIRIENDAGLDVLEGKVDALWKELLEREPSAAAGPV